MTDLDPSKIFRKTIIIPIVIYLLLILINFTAILIVNDFKFTYTIDDPYIHLSLAENISNCHYGINKDEYSSPASSIIYPVLLLPLVKTEFGYLLPLVINIFSSIGIIYFFWKLLTLVFANSKLNKNQIQLVIILFLISIIIAGNLVYSTFRGMEHTLQALMSIIILWSTAEFINKNRIPRIFYISVVIAPLVRYENLSISLAILLFLFIYRNKKVAWSAIIIIILLAGFSYFLLSLGLEPLPLSVLRKSKVLENDLFSNILTQGGLALIITLILLINYFRIKSNPSKEKLLSVFFAAIILVHMVLGVSGRYTEYLITSSLFILIFLYKDWIIKALETYYNKYIALFVIIPLLISYKQVISIFVVPFAANNIFEQQYQMHRFAVEYYKKPVAVNDIGYVSFRNDNYVLDIFGLSSLESYRHWNSAKNISWMDSLAEKHNVNLIMIYEHWFKEIPSNWIKVGELHLGNKQMTVSGSVVSFFIRDSDHLDQIHSLLSDFQKTIPEKTKLILF